jgi:hypothetical protein
MSRKIAKTMATFAIRIATTALIQRGFSQGSTMNNSLFMRYDIVKGSLGSGTSRETFAKDQVRLVFSIVQSAIAVPDHPGHDLLLGGEGLGYAPAASTAHLRR